MDPKDHCPAENRRCHCGCNKLFDRVTHCNVEKFEADMAQSIRAEITSPSNVGHATDSAKIVCPGVGQVKAGKEKERKRRLIVLLVMLSKRMKAMRKRGRLGNNYLVFLRMRQKIEISKV